MGTIGGVLIRTIGGILDRIIRVVRGILGRTIGTLIGVKRNLTTFSDLAVKRIKILKIIGGIFKVKYRVSSEIISGIVIVRRVRI